MNLKVNSGIVTQKKINGLNHDPCYNTNVDNHILCLKICTCNRVSSQANPRFNAIWQNAVFKLEINNCLGIIAPGSKVYVAFFQQLSI